jgi:hypothetical protein
MPKTLRSLARTATFAGAFRYVRWRLMLRSLAHGIPLQVALQADLPQKNTLSGSHKPAFLGLHIDEKRL